MSDSESDNEEFTIANDLVVTKYKMAGDIANRYSTLQSSILDYISIKGTQEPD